MDQISWLGIRLEGWLTLLAIVLGPIIALAVQRRMDEDRESQRRKLAIFKELMATRAAKLSTRHVDALNAIEMEFSSGRGSDKEVARAWRVYLDHLGDTNVDRDDQGAIARWGDKSNDLLVELLFEMSRALKFDFDKVSIRKGVYSPRAHGELETDQFLVRKFLLELMEGKRAIWSGVFTGERPLQMQLVHPPQPPAEARPPVAPERAADPVAVAEAINPERRHE